MTQLPRLFPPQRSPAVLSTGGITDHLIQRAILDAPGLEGGFVLRIDGFEVEHDAAEHEAFRFRLLDGLAQRGWKVQADVHGRASSELVLHGESGAALHLRLDMEDALCAVFAPEARSAEAGLADFRELGARLCGLVRRGDFVPVRVWSLTKSGPTSRLRRMRCPRWREISGNYPGIANELSWLMGLERPFDLGRVVFWHGAAGTGKSWAVRALLREWRSMQLELVSDPAAFLASPELAHELLCNPPFRPGDGSLGSRGKRGRLLVFEDAPELQLAEQGPGLEGTLSRLLNTTDGLLDGPVPTVVLATTHEPLPQHQTALLRPGRCLQVQQFPLLSAQEARGWLGNPPATGPSLRGEMSLAELYACRRADPVRTPAPRTRVGFQQATGT
jgi:hypothetical protein